MLKWVHSSGDDHHESTNTPHELMHQMHVAHQNKIAPIQDEFLFREFYPTVARSCSSENASVVIMGDDAEIQAELAPWAAEHNIVLRGDEIEALMSPGQYTVIQPMLDKVAELKRRGFKTGLLTNTFAEFRPTMQQDLRFGDFTAVVESFAVGSRKPEPDIYQATADMLGVSHEEILYLDDFPQNIEMAQSFGWSTIQVSDPLRAIPDIELFLNKILSN